jgi:hypothetical protein
MAHEFVRARQDCPRSGRLRQAPVAPIANLARFYVRVVLKSDRAYMLTLLRL